MFLTAILLVMTKRQIIWQSHRRLLTNLTPQQLMHARLVLQTTPAVTASLSASTDGEMMLVFEAENAVTTLTAIAITKYTADTSSSVSSSTVLPMALQTTNTVTLSGTYEEGDVISVTVAGAFSGGSFDYTVAMTLRRLPLILVRTLH